jgi:Fe2+ or Zn2+ uptake regulation protein
VKTPEELVELYRSRGYKITPQRLAIFNTLHSTALTVSQGHPTAEALHQRIATVMPSMSLRTVYSVLGELVEMGELLQLDLGTGSARFDTCTDAHHHLICRHCGVVVDVDVDNPMVRPSSPSAVGFSIDDTEIVFRGTCPDCAVAALVS